MAYTVGAAIALFLLSGRWSLSRISLGESWVLFEPRVWIVAGLVAIAYSPALGRMLAFRPSNPYSLLPETLAFSAYFILSALWAPSSELVATKAYEMALVGAALASVARIGRWVGPRRLADGLWSALGVSLALMALLGLASTAGGEGDRLSVLGGGPNVFGRNMAVLLMLALAALLEKRGHRWVWLALAALSAVLALLSGSRGAMLGIAAGGATVVYIKRLPIGRFTRIAIGLALVAWFVVTFTDVGRAALLNFENRFVRLTLEDRHDAGRMPIYEFAWALGVAKPIFGQGLAGFAATGFHVYPHNIGLEAFCEGGVVGALLLASILVPLGRCLIVRDRSLRARDAAVFVVLLMSSLFTGDFYDSRGVLLVALLLSMQRERGLHPA